MANISTEADRLVRRLERGEQIQAVDQDKPSKLYIITLGPDDNPGPGESTGHRSTESVKTNENFNIIQVKRQKALGNGGFGIVNAAKLITDLGKRETNICLKQSIIEEGKDTSKSLLREYTYFKIMEGQDKKKKRVSGDSSEDPTGHENIIKFLFFCIEEPTDQDRDRNRELQYFIGLEYFLGDDLSACIHTLQRNKKESFTYNQQISIMQGVMSAVEYLESNGLIHCDIKPHNVLFNVDTLKLKLIDFGCAVKVDENRKEKLGGTTEYMAPETFADDPDQDKCELRRADVYSVAALMYRVLTFCRPWHHLQKVRDARQEQKGGHQKTKDIIKSELKEYEGRCLDAENPKLLTPLQEHIIDRSQNHYKDSSDLCEIVKDMLYYSPHDRPDISEIISNVAKLNCSVQKQISRTSMDSQQSRENSFSAGDNSLPIFVFSSTQPTLGDTELNERHKSPAAANDVPGEGKALEAEDDHESENEDDGGTAAHDEHESIRPHFQTGSDEEEDVGGGGSDDVEPLSTAMKNIARGNVGDTLAVFGTSSNASDNNRSHGEQSNNL